MNAPSAGNKDVTGPGLLFVWVVTASLAFLIASGVVMGLPAWLLPLREGWYRTVLFAAYLASTAIPSMWVLIGRRISPLVTALMTAVIFAAAWYVAPRTQFGVPAGVALKMGALGIFLNLFLVPDRKRFLPRLGMLATFVALIAVMSAPATRNHWIYRALNRPMTYKFDTVLYPVQLNYFREHIPRPEVVGGALAPAGEHMLLVTGDGLFYLLDMSGDAERLTVRPLSYVAPINSTEFAARTKGLGVRELFRVMDVLLLDTPVSGEKQILVSHHYWHSEQSCFVVRVSAFIMQWEAFLADRNPPQWKTVYETAPCLPLKPGNKYPFAGDLSGGRMLETEPRHILLTVGDHRFNGVDASPEHSQDDGSDYGKILEINLTDGSSSIFTSGHRNPQGLYRDELGRIWSTEHGPKGGDELNLIRKGQNYGWPWVTLGTQYGMFVWPIGQREEPEKAFQDPAFAWVPSIGISNLTSIDGGTFSRWQDDLVIASLKANSLFRVRIERNRPVMIEVMPVYDRVRDIMRDRQGRIIFWTDSASIGLLKLGAD